MGTFQIRILGCAAMIAALSGAALAAPDTLGLPPVYEGKAPSILRAKENVKHMDFPEVPPALAEGLSSDARDLVTDYLGGIASTERSEEDQRIAFARLFYSEETVRPYLDDLLPRARFSEESYRAIQHLYSLWDREAELEPSIQDTMRRSTYFATSTSVNGRSLGTTTEFPGNPPRKTPSFFEPAKDSKEPLRIVVRPNDLTETWNNERGFAVYVVNDSDDQLLVPFTNGQPMMVLEGYDETTAVWAALEGAPTTACNNTTHTGTLGRGECWKFSATLFEGDTTKRMRVRLRDGATNYMSYDFFGKVPSALLEHSVAAKAAHTASDSAKAKK